MADEFWTKVKAQLNEARSAKSADDVIRIFSRERNPYGSTEMVVGDAFFAGSGGNTSLYEVLDEAGWHLVWQQSSIYYTMKAPDDSMITYIEGDIYRGGRR